MQKKQQKLKINSDIFRAYDIRGKYPDDLYPKLAESITQEFVELLRRKYSVKAPDLKIVVGRDGRLAAPIIQQAVINGLSLTGVQAINIDLVSTDMIYFAVGKYQYDGGIMITASHNPKEYIGLKFVGRGVEGIDGENGIYEIRDKLKLKVKSEKFGSIIKRDILSEYIDYVLSFIDVGQIKPLKVVVDAGNGVIGGIFTKLASKLPIELFSVFFKIDGNFPNRDPDPGKDIGLDKIKQVIVQNHADIGFAFDPDGDRIFMIDEYAQFVPGVLAIALMSEHILQKNPQAVILYNVTTGRAVQDVIDKHQARGIMTPVGHAKIKRLAKQHNADFAGEAQSGHFFFKENFYADNALIFACRLMELLSISNQPLSSLIKPHQKYYISGEINTQLKNQKDAEAKIKKLKKCYHDGKILEIDGVRVDYPNWWFGVRLSNTEPLLRLNVEADNQKLMEKKRDEILAMIKNE